MIEDLQAYEEYLWQEYQYSVLECNEEKANYFSNKAFDCLMLLDYFREMKLTTEEWYRIKLLVKEYRSIKQNGKN